MGDVPNMRMSRVIPVRCTSTPPATFACPGLDLAVHEIADQLPISRPAVSRHLRLLKESGLVEEEPQGTRRIYRLQEEGIVAVQTYLQQVWGDAAARFRLAADNLPPKERP